MADGIWNAGVAAGDWAVASNWMDQVVATGTDAWAYFNNAPTVTLNANRTIGTVSGPVTVGGNYRLTLAGVTPQINNGVMNCPLGCSTGLYVSNCTFNNTNNNITGDIYVSGTLVITAGYAIGSTTGITSGGTVELRGATTQVARTLASDLWNSAGNNTYPGPIRSGNITSSAGTLTLTSATGIGAEYPGYGAVAFDGAGNISVDSPIVREQVTKNGSGTLYLKSAKSTYSYLTINDGVLEFLQSVYDWVGSGSTGQSGLGNSVVVVLTMTGGTLRYNGTTASTRVGDISIAGSVAFEAINTGSIQYFGYSTSYVSTSAAATLTLKGTATTDNQFNQLLKDASTTKKSSFIKDGTGTWTFGGGTYTGDSTVTLGLLKVAAGQTLGKNNTVTLQGTSASSRGKLQVTGTGKGTYQNLKLSGGVLRIGG